MPLSVRRKFRCVSYRKAAAILKYGLPDEFAEVVSALDAFEITTTMIRKPGGNESDIPKVISGLLRHRGWYETTISGDLHISRKWREPAVSRSGKDTTRSGSSTFVRERYLDRSLGFWIEQTRWPALFLSRFGFSVTGHVRGRFRGVRRL
ncbi:MAG: hypothetical protein GY798_28200, partial [Hyphomicrobiales bacterium]|nr:hypothetical protein [Hyphomicrobiales bacterium]